MNKFEINVREGIIPKARNSSYPFNLEAPEFHVTYTPIRCGIFNIYLTREIESADQFTSAIEVLQAAGENDTVVIHLSTPGGSLDATDTFLMAMQDCEAKIIIRASGGVHSAGTVILMHADEFYLSDNFNSLIHNGSTGVGGKFSDFKAQAKHTIDYMHKVLRKTYAGFLTDKEIEDLIEGKDIWLDGEAFGKRFEARNAYLAKQAETEQQAARQALLAELGITEPEAAKPKRTKKKKKEATEE